LLPFEEPYARVLPRLWRVVPHRPFRLFRRGGGRYGPGRLGQVNPFGSRPLGRLHGPILHYTYDSLADCLAKMERYGEQAARMLHAQGARAGAWDVAFRPLWRFVRAYLLRLGFLDGAPGAAMAWARAYEAFRRYALLWELSRFSCYLASMPVAP